MFDKIINKFFRKAEARASLKNCELAKLDISQLPTQQAAAEVADFARAGQQDLYPLAEALLQLLAKEISASAKDGDNHLFFSITYNHLARLSRKTTGKSMETYTSQEANEALCIVGGAIVSALKRKGYYVESEFSPAKGAVTTMRHALGLPVEPAYRIRVEW